MSEIAQEVERAYEKAAELNLDVVVPDDYTLQLDYDNGVPERFEELIHLINCNFGVSEGQFNEGILTQGFNIKQTTSKSGNKHIYVRLEKPITATERLVFQAALGSDPKREILSLARLKRGEPNPTLLFEVKKVENNLDCGVQTGYERV